MINPIKLSYVRQTSIYITKRCSYLSSVKKFISSRFAQSPEKVDLTLMRISPTESPGPIKDRFIPLSKTTLLRKLSQNNLYVPKTDTKSFQEFCNHLDTCISNRLFFIFNEIKMGYDLLNPDIEISNDGLRQSKNRSKMLDDEFWFVQKLTKLMEFANFEEMSREKLEFWLNMRGTPSELQAWIDPREYDLFKVWVLGKEENQPSGLLNKFFKNFLTAKIYKSPRSIGNHYRRVVVAIRLKKNDKIELKMFKNLSEGELLHTLPKANHANSSFDNSVLGWTSLLFTVGFGGYSLLPVVTPESSWFLTSSHQLATVLCSMSAAVFLFELYAIQQKRLSYWRWRSDLSYGSIIANNRGVISLLADRGHDEIFKETILAYVGILHHPPGITQSLLESEMELWISENCSPELKNSIKALKLDLTDACNLLRQLNIIDIDAQTGAMKPQPVENAVQILGSAFNSKMVLTDPQSSSSIDRPITERYEKK